MRLSTDLLFRTSKSSTIPNNPINFFTTNPELTLYQFTEIETHYDDSA